MHLFYLLVFSLLTLSLEASSYYAKFDLSNNACLRMTSDRTQLISYTNKHIDVFTADTLTLVSSIDSVQQGSGCLLSDDNNYFILTSRHTVYVYDLKHSKLYKKFEKPQGSSISSVSLSKDERYINTIERRNTDVLEKRSKIYRLEIATGKETMVYSIKKREAIYVLDGDTLYAYDTVQERAYRYNFLTDQKQVIEKSLFEKYQMQPRVKRIEVGDVVYKLDAGLKRVDSTSQDEPHISYVRHKLLKKEHYYELAVQEDTLVQKGFNVYRSWDIKKGRLNWVHDLNLNMSVEFSNEATLGMAFFHHKKHILITPAFGQKILDFSLKDGSYSALELKHYGALALSGDDSVLAVRHHDKNIYYYETKNYSLLDAKGVAQHKKAVQDAKERLNKNYKPVDFTERRTSFYEFEKGKYLYTYLKEGTLLKSELYSGLVVAKTVGLPRFGTLTFTDNDQTLIVEKRDTFALYNTDDLKLIAKFYSFKEGQWAVITPQGYFNASSMAVIENVLKLTRTKAKDQERFLKQWYRPDIVSALLQNRNIEALKHKKNPFKLDTMVDEKSALPDMSYQEIKRHRDYVKLFHTTKSKYSVQNDQKLLTLIEEMILDAQTKKEFRYAYRSLRSYPFTRYKVFARSRVSKLNAKSPEQTVFIDELSKQSASRKFLESLLVRGDISASLKKEINKQLKREKLRSLYSLDQSLFVSNEKLLWIGLEENYNLSQEALTFLYARDTKRYLKTVKENTFKHYAQVVKMREKGSIVLNYYYLDNDFRKLLEIEKQGENAKLRMIAKEAVLYYQNNVHQYNGAVLYYRYLLKYGTSQERAFVKSGLQKRISFLVEELKKNYTPYKRPYAYHSSNFSTAFTLYELYDHNEAVERLLEFNSERYKYLYGDLFYSMGVVKDRRFVPILFEHLYVENGVISYEVLYALLQYDMSVVKKVVQELNRVKSCKDIPYEAKVNSMIEMKLDAKAFKRYRCGNE